MGNAGIPELSDEESFLQNTFTVKTDEKQRLSQVWVYYGKIDNAGDDKPENYSNLHIDADLTKEEAETYGSKSIKVIKSDWIENASQAALLTGRLLARFEEPPKFIKFKLDAKDSALMPSDLVNVNTKYIQGVDGANRINKFEIVSAKEKETGHIYEYEAMVSNFSFKYAFIAPDGLGDYSSESDDNRNAYAFIAPDTGVFNDGTKGYKII